MKNCVFFSLPFIFIFAAACSGNKNIDRQNFAKIDPYDNAFIGKNIQFVQMIYPSGEIDTLVFSPLGDNVEKRNGSFVRERRGFDEFHRIIRYWGGDEHANATVTYDTTGNVLVEKWNLLVGNDFDQTRLSANYSYVYNVFDDEGQLLSSIDDYGKIIVNYVYKDGQLSLTKQTFLLVNDYSTTTKYFYSGGDLTGIERYDRSLLDKTYFSRGLPDSIVKFSAQRQREYSVRMIYTFFKK